MAKSEGVLGYIDKADIENAIS